MSNYLTPPTITINGIDPDAINKSIIQVPAKGRDFQVILRAFIETSNTYFDSYYVQIGAYPRKLRIVERRAIHGFKYLICVTEELPVYDLDLNGLMEVLSKQKYWQVC